MRVVCHDCKSLQFCHHSVLWGSTTNQIASPYLQHADILICTVKKEYKKNQHLAIQSPKNQKQILIEGIQALRIKTGIGDDGFNWSSQMPGIEGVRGEEKTK